VTDRDYHHYTGTLTSTSFLEAAATWEPRPSELPPFTRKTRRRSNRRLPNESRKTQVPALIS